MDGVALGDVVQIVPSFVDARLNKLVGVHVVTHHLDPHVRVVLVEQVQSGEQSVVKSRGIESQLLAAKAHGLDTSLGHKHQIAGQSRIWKSQWITTR